MLKSYRIVHDKVVEAENGGGQILVYVAPDETERKRLLNDFQLDEHTLASALDPDELSRLEVEDDHLALIFKRPKNSCSYETLLFKIESIGVYLFKDRLILVSAEDSLLFDKPMIKVPTLQHVMLKLVHRCIQHFYGHLKAINAIASELETKINQSMENKSLLQMFALEKSLTYYLSAMSSNGKVIERLRANAHNPATFGFLPEHQEFVDDLAIENGQCYEQANIHASVFASLMDARASIVSNNLNLLMRNLTMMMIALMWPPLVCGYMSMNVLLPVNHESLWPFIGVVVLSLGPLAVVGGYIWRQRRKRPHRR